MTVGSKVQGCIAAKEREKLIAICIYNLSEVDSRIEIPVSAWAGRDIEVFSSFTVVKIGSKNNYSFIFTEGWIENNARFIINDMRIGKELSYDIEVVVNQREKGQYLKLPKAVLNKFGTVNLDKENQKIIFE